MAFVFVLLPFFKFIFYSIQYDLGVWQRHSCGVVCETAETFSSVLSLCVSKYTHVIHAHTHIHTKEKENDVMSLVATRGIIEWQRDVYL